MQTKGSEVMQGWIKIHRQIKENWVYQSSIPFCKFAAWIDILLSANHDDAKFNHGSKLIQLSKGEFITSEIKLSERWGWSRKTVRSFLKLLENDGMITKHSTTKYTTISVLNWAFYQIEEQQKNNKGTTKEQQKNTNKNHNNVKNDKKNTKVDFSSIVYSYTESECLRNTIHDFIECRSKYKTPFKLEKQLSAFLEKLDKLAKTDGEKIEVLKQSIANGWIGIFEVKQNFSKQQPQQSKQQHHNFDQRSYDDVDLDKFYTNID